MTWAQLSASSRCFQRKKTCGLSTVFFSFSNRTFEIRDPRSCSQTGRDSTLVYRQQRRRPLGWGGTTRAAAAVVTQNARQVRETCGRRKCHRKKKGFGEGRAGEEKGCCQGRCQGGPRKERQAAESRGAAAAVIQDTG